MVTFLTSNTVTPGEINPEAGELSEDAAAPDGSETEHSSGAEEIGDKEASADTRILKMLYKGNIEEISRQEQQSKKAAVHNKRHNCYRNTRCTSVAQDIDFFILNSVLSIEGVETPLSHPP